MKNLIAWAVKNSPAMNVMLMATLIVGSVSLMIMRREVFPEFELEIILVTVPYPGASAEEVEEGICQKGRGSGLFDRRDSQADVGRQGRGRFSGAGTGAQHS